MNLVMAIIWLGFAVVLYAALWIPLDLGSLNVLKGYPLLPIMCVVMSVYRFCRWYMKRIEAVVIDQPPPVRPRVEKPSEYLPDFDFNNTPPKDPPTNPSVNGKH